MYAAHRFDEQHQLPYGSKLAICSKAVNSGMLHRKITILSGYKFLQSAVVAMLPITGIGTTSMLQLMYDCFIVMHILTHRCYQAAHNDVAKQQLLVVEPVRAPWPNKTLSGCKLCFAQYNDTLAECCCALACCCLLLWLSACLAFA